MALAEGAAAPDPRSRRRRPRGSWRFRRDLITRGRVILAAAVVIVVGVAAGVLATVLPGPPSLNAPVATAWQPARPLPSGSGGVTAPAGTWRLMGYLVAKGWQENTTGPEPGWLTCPTARDLLRRGRQLDIAERPGRHELALRLQRRRAELERPARTGRRHVHVGAVLRVRDGLRGGRAVLRSSARVPHHRERRAFLDRAAAAGRRGPDRDTRLRHRGDLPGAGIGLWGAGDPGLRAIFSGMRFFVTADGGTHFTVTSFPKDAAIQSVACPTASHCVAIGVYSSFDPKAGPDLDHGVLLTSDDGGLTWQRGTWPTGYGPGAQPEVTCSDASHCAMIGFVEHDGTERDQIGGYTSGKDAVQYTVIGFSSDGGQTWTTSTFPHSLPYPMIDALTCPTTTTCYAAGSDLIAQHIGNTYNAGSSVVAVTHNRGRSWQRVTFAVPAQVPGGMQGDSFMDIGQIECPQADACVAIGVSDQGSKSTPIYTNHG